MAPPPFNLMSSPDPLNDPSNDPVPSSAAPSTRRITRSQHSSSFVALSNASPRKQTFALDIGNDNSPQKIFVTVEAGQAENEENEDARRRLFASPGPRSAVRRREKATTTTVPLRGMSEDVAPTPKRRGRPPGQSNTPTPRPKKRAGTPLPKTAKQANKRTRISGEEEEVASELGVADSQATPRSTTRKTASKTPRRKAATPAKETDPAEQPKKRGRPRRQAPTEEMEVTADDVAHEPPVTLHDVPADSEENPMRQETPSPAPTYSNENEGVREEEEEDIWLASLSEPPTPRGRGPRAGDDRFSPSMPALAEQDSALAQEAQPQEAQPQETQPQEAQPHAEAIENEVPMEVDDRSDTLSHTSDAGALVPRDQDTIANGEDFSMILMDSVPSFQRNASDLPEMGETTSLIVSRTLESLHQERPTEGEEEVQDADATPKASSRSDRLHGAGGWTGIMSGGPLFSQPPPPQTWSRSPRRNRRSPLNRQRSPLSRQLAVKSLQREVPAVSSPSAAAGSSATVGSATVGSSATAPPMAMDNSQRRPTVNESAYEDSFSEIPEAVLEAATPYRPLVFQQDEEEEEEVRHIEPHRPIRSRSVSLAGSAVSSLQTGQPLTPDATPSPVESDQGDEGGRPSLSKSNASSTARSSPPEFAAAGGLSGSSSHHSRHSSSETPLPAASPPQPPLPPAVRDNVQMDGLAVPSGIARPALSPIVRAGLALQSVTSDPPTPKDRDSLLGSPFRSSTGRRTQSPAPQREDGLTAEESPAPTAAAPSQQPSSAQQSDRVWPRAFAPFNQLKSLVIQGAQVFSPRLNSTPMAEASLSAHGSRRSPSEKPQLRDSPPNENIDVFSAASSTRAALASDDGMDWEPEPDMLAMALNPGAATGSISSMFATKGSSNSDQDVVFETDADMELRDEDEPEADDDIWAVEAQRPTPARPRVTVPREAKAPEPAINAPRRGKLPSPWRKNSKRLLYSDELAQAASAKANEKGADGSRDFSMLSAQSEMIGLAPQEKVVPKKTGRVNLSDFFSSPALVPQMKPPVASSAEWKDKARPSSILGRQATNAEPEASQGKQPKQQDKAPPRMPAVSERLSESQSEMPSVPQKAFQPMSQRRTDLFSPVKSQPATTRAEEPREERPTSPSTPERSVFASIPQKRNFTPLLGRSSKSLFSSNPSQVTAKPSLFSNPPRRGGHFTVAEDDANDADASLLSRDESSIQVTPLKQLPDRQASPTKSCLRSPLKAKTPGRVVEFTSSTLSPLAQLQARAERSGLTSWGQDFNPILANQQQQQQQQRRPLLGEDETDKENADSRASNLNNPATVPPSYAKPQLSRTSWSRAHWLRLDELLQERRRGGPLAFQLRHTPCSPKKSRVSAALKGKIVTAQGETMALEQWHLDIVDAFCREVGGWDEPVLAKRLFALLVGEERRRQGLVPSQRGVDV